MEILLNSFTNLTVCSNAIRECWQSHDKSDSVDGVCGENDKDLIDRVGNKFKHSSTLEHLTYSFSIVGISRACLQELARHRHASLSVKSSRYTLKELKHESPFDLSLDDTVSRASKYLVFTGTEEVDNYSITALENLRQSTTKYTNDIAKYCMPECYKTSLAWTINARALQNFLSLRTSTAALKEIRELAVNLYSSLPEDHKFIFKDYVPGIHMKELTNDTSR